MKPTQRLLSLDVFRGMTIALMILVNNPGSWSTVYAPFLHADWHGCTPTDLVFPFFVFIMGVSISLALTKRKERGDNQKAIYIKILKRTFLIFLIGLLLHAIPYFNLSSLRIPGVLQRIAVVYGVCAIIFMRNNLKAQVWITAGILLGYWALMALVPVPGHGPANFEVGTNLSAWLDNQLLAGHMWSQTKTWDPEGVLSTLGTIGTGMLGVFTGTWLRQKMDDYQKLVGLFAVGAILIVGGLTWDLAFPINKKIWTSSYTLYTGGLALQALALTYWLTDVLNYKKWTKPFVIFGMNPLFLYALSGLLAKLLIYTKWDIGNGDSQSLWGYIYSNLFESLLSPYNASLAFAISFVLIHLGVGWFLYKKKIFIKV
ncbi:MAG: DUF5009 domain-containing protein [Bacteroidetes bacterium]|jgi:predicted acyltransferase|nr:DUF5009 domain-containing protein [Bacteroidota bacterium]